MKEQANKAMGRAKHLAEGASDKVKSTDVPSSGPGWIRLAALHARLDNSTSSTTTPNRPRYGVPDDVVVDEQERSASWVRSFTTRPTSSAS